MFVRKFGALGQGFIKISQCMLKLLSQGLIIIFRYGDSFNVGEKKHTPHRPAEGKCFITQETLNILK